NFPIRFLTSPSLVDVWQRAIPTDIALKDARELIRLVHETADRVLRRKGDVPNAPEFAEWYTRMEKQVDTVRAGAAQGIVLGGATADDVRLLNNTIEGVVQGIHLGVSHREVARGPRDTAGTVLIAGNRIAVLLAPEAARAR
ncbi:MAG: hypothetical protein C4321_07240, partial [Chloroflexota bacterium]